MIKNIVFDMGQVLLHWSPRKLMDRLELSEEDKLLLLDELFGDVEWTAMDRGRLLPDEVYRLVCPRIPEHLHSKADYLINHWWEDGLDPFEGMDELIAELKRNGYCIYLLTNAPSYVHRYLDSVPGSKYFSGVLVSADEKLLKPEHEIYERLYEHFHLNAGECLFIDDNPANVDGAACTGMNGIVFRGDIPRLRRDLKRFGVDVSE